MSLIDRLMHEGKLKDNLHDVRWKLTTDDPEVTEIAHTLQKETCEDCGGFMIELGVEGLGFRSSACMKCGKFCNYDYEYAKVHEAGGGFGSVQLVTKDRSIIANYGFREPLYKRTLMDLKNELIHFPNVDIEKSFVTMKSVNSYPYWVGEDVDTTFYEEFLDACQSENIKERTEKALSLQVH